MGPRALARGAGHAHDDVATTLGGHLGAGDAAGVNALDDDVARLCDLLGRDLAVPGEPWLEDDLGAALEVEAQLRGEAAVAELGGADEQAHEGQGEDRHARQGATGERRVLIWAMSVCLGRRWGLCRAGLGHADGTTVDAHLHTGGDNEDR